ncbi:ABC transporter permease [Dactylosporangium salmoneum]|uniref:ABC transporter permease n=1 Tax=Dactylosporangium salmoneum TaxID=53361 RepID=A0ABN3H0V3_9ACTN
MLTLRRAAGALFAGGVVLRRAVGALSAGGVVLRRAAGARVAGGVVLMLRRAAGALVAVSVGVALLAAALLLLAAGRPVVPARFAATPVVVSTTVPWSASRADELAAALAAVPGVAKAYPDHTFFLQDAEAGHGWAWTRLTAGRAPERDGEVAADRAVGARVTLLTAAGPAQFTVTGSTDAPGYYVADAVAARLAPGVRAIGLVLAPGADAGRVAAAAGELVGADGRVLSGAARADLEPAADARLRWIGLQVLTGVTALSGFAAVFVVASTFAYRVAQRRRELGLLRAVGATPRQVRRMVYGEALLVGAAGAAIGVAVGAALAPPVGRLLVGVGLEPATYEVGYAPLPILAALAAGPLVALLGAGAAARRAARVRPLEALREAAVERRAMGRARWGIGGVLLAAGIACGFGTAAAGAPEDGAAFALYGAMALVTGVAVLSPAAVAPLARVLRLPRRRGGGAIGLLVREGASSAARRTAATASPVLLTVAFAVLVAGMVRTSTAAYAAGRQAEVDAGWVLVPDGPPGLTDAAVAGAPGGTALLPATVYDGDRALRALGVDPAAFAATDRGARVLDGALGDLADEDAAVVPRQAGRRVGEDYPLVFADGERVRLRVVAVVADGSVRGDVLLSRATVRAHDPSALTSAVLLRDPALRPAAGARVVTAAAWAAEADAAEDRLVWLFTLMLIAVSAGYGAIAVANTLFMAAAGRAADLRVLRLAGATHRQVLACVAAESGLVVLLGALLGGAVALGALVSIRAGLSAQVGAPVALVVPWPVVAGAVGLCLAIALLAGLVPTHRGRPRAAA